DEELFRCDEGHHMIPMPHAAGYIPLKLNDRLKGKVEYEIVWKLGWGARSSVWLGRHDKSPNDPSFFAIQVLTAMELLIAGHIFQLDTLPNIGLNEVHFARIMELLVQFDPASLDKCSKRDAYFDETASGSLAHRLSTAIFEGQDLGSANDFLKCCLTLDPSLRPSAEELLEDPWLVSGQV
ncbi:hypothetical protein AN958_02953, partial [Leucoagaricus sp. SymC.cos]